jgi:hypothetical protein
MICSSVYRFAFMAHSHVGGLYSDSVLFEGGHLSRTEAIEKSRNIISQYKAHCNGCSK